MSVFGKLVCCGHPGRLLAVILAAAGALAGAEHRGSVTSAGLPIPGAIVTATLGDRSLVTSTDESGAYVFEDLPPGSWTVAIEAFGFEKTKRTVNVPGEPAAAWELKLKPVGASAPTPPPVQAAKRAAPEALFQRLEVNQTVQEEVLASISAQPGAEAQEADLGQNANESFLVNGSLSRGLQIPRQEGEFMPFGDFRPGMPGAQGNPPGFSGGPEAAAGGPGMRGPGMGGPGMGGMGGRGGMGGPMAGGRMGGPGGPGGRFGGRGGQGQGGQRGAEGRQRPEWQGRPGTMLFGNRANRGRETFRGGAFFTLRNSALDARPYSLTGQTVDKPSYAQTRFGLTGGGQLRIPKLVTSDKTFVFLNYSGTRSRNPFDAIATVPQEAERLGDFSQSIVRGPVLVYDPTTKQPFPDNRVPASRINPAATGLLSYFPRPNQPGPVQNYQFITSTPQNTDNFSVRTFHSFSRRDRVGGSFSLQNRSSEAPQLFGFRDTLSGRGLSLDLSWTHTIRTGLIGSLRWSFSRNRSSTLPYFAYGPNVAAELGITGTSDLPINYGPPNLTFTNFGALTDASAALQRNQSSAVNGGLTVVRGPHTWSMGTEYRRNQANNRSDQNGRGTFTFSGIATSGFDAAGQPLAGTGFDFADFLLGLPQSSSIRFGSADTYFRGSIYSAFAQDEWRVRSNLTLNLGVRYEFLTPLVEKYNRMANLDVAPGFTAVAPVTPGADGPYTGVFPRGLVEPDHNNIAPRLGLAWKPFPKSSMLVRAGYGVYFNGSVYNQAASRLAQQPPFAKTAAINTSLANVLTLQNGFAASPSAQITNTYAFDRFYQVGYAQTWSLSVQRDLPHSIVAEIGYLGTKGTKLDIQRLPNRSAPGSPLTAEERRQIGNATGFTFDSSEGNSIYHAAQVRVTRRFRRGLSANALYTFSKSIDNVSTFGGGGAVVAQNDKDLRAERGLSSFDQRHTLNLFYILTSPGGPGSSAFAAHGLTGRLLRDWTLSGGMTMRSGTPFTAAVLGNRSDSGGTGAVGSARADSTGLPVTIAGSFFNPAAFTLPPAGRFGNAGRNTIPGLTNVVFNMAVGRTFRIAESRRSVDLRVESNNTLNAVNITRIGTTINASNYALPLNAGPMRTMQASLRFRF